MIDVLFLLLPGSLILDWAGPAEALRIANALMAKQGKPEPFALRFCAPRADSVSSVGVRLAELEMLPATLAARPSWVVLVGQMHTPVPVDTPDNRTLLNWLRPLRLASGQLELLTICAGTVLAAHAGLLAGRRVTTHHHHLDELQSVAPACEVVRNRVFVEDSPVYSSAGVTTGIDLILHRIEAICGPALAAQVAQTMVVALRRGPHDPELSPFLAYRNHVHPALHRVQDAVSQSPQSDWSVPGMAAVAHTSPRHLTRLFLEYAQIAPLQYLRRIRLAVAQTALASGDSVTAAAAAAGFSSDTQLRRAWQHFAVPGTPSRPSE
ncbi:GlxA family transcriptional regulator [Massilia sp. CF038]|uniref:GlxA family transcriptional regulator n=1 Tax=Massilia sp. CF038 TaxID=1881045 RepID=UPI000922F2C0|nr:helix-turn-helix domain-containing protein [Massilia sp. CF038]SHH19982.1 Transcriptional regulator GlxA family, contains an amidase domain and an AraC-type DNA-binding HTH domain [Massilia sp. CF038]